MGNTIPTAGATVAAMIRALNAYIAAHPDTPHDKLFSELEAELRTVLNLQTGQ